MEYTAWVFFIFKFLELSTELGTIFIKEIIIRSVVIWYKKELKTNTCCGCSEQGDGNFS